MRTSTCAAALALLAVSALPAWATCYSDSEATAARVRVMQTDFMVAALSCDQQGVPEVRQRYTTIVKTFTGEFAVHGKELIGYFQRAGGGMRGLDSYVTSLANQMALRSNGTPNYCRGILAKMERALTGKTTMAALAPAVGYEQSGGPGDCGKSAPVMVKEVIKPNESAKVPTAPVVKPAAAVAPVAPVAAPLPPPVTTTTTADVPPQDMSTGPDAFRTGFAP